MKRYINKSIVIMLFTILFAGCFTRSKVSLSDDVVVQATMHGIEVEIKEDVAVGTLLSQNVILNNVTVPLTGITIALTGARSEDFSITLVAGSEANTYLGKVSLFHSLAGAGGTTLTLNATASADGQSIGSVPIRVHIIDVPQKTIVMLCDEVNGTEPWITDGTAAGTKPLANLNPTGDSDMRSSTVMMNGDYYMSLDDGLHGHTLWKSDGTSAVTMMVKDLNETGNNERVSNLTQVGNHLLFSAFRKELWLSDGTEEHTIMIKEINSSEIRAFASYGEKLYFIALDGDHAAAELWESNGTAQGTHFLLEIPDVSGKPRYLAFEGDTLYVALPNNSARTINMKKMNMQATPLAFSDDNTLNNVGIRWMGTFQEKLHLITINLTSSHSNIWKKEGDTYTKLPLDIDFDFGGIQRLENFFLFNTSRFDDIGNRYMQLWKSDTTEDGTEIILEIRCPGYPDMES